MAHTVRRHLRLDVDAYDAAIRRFIPRYEEMLGEAVEAVSAVRPARVLDLGAGTGALSALLLERDEVGSVELVDVDPEMLDRARLRLARFGGRARFRLGSFEDPLPGCDAVCASLALHHIPTLEAKAALYAHAFRGLRPGGVLVNADCAMPASGPERDRLFRSWADHMVASGISEADAWRHFAAWAEEDTYMPLEDELTALRSAGFEARCIWRGDPMTVVVARRPNGGS